MVIGQELVRQPRHVAVERPGQRLERERLSARLRVVALRWLIGEAHIRRGRTLVRRRVHPVEWDQRDARVDAVQDGQLASLAGYRQAGR